MSRFVQLNSMPPRWPSSGTRDAFDQIMQSPRPPSQPLAQKLRGFRQMSTKNREVMQGIDDSLKDLRRVAGDVELQPHLVRLEHNTRLQALQVELTRVEALVAREVSEAARRTVVATTEAFKLLYAAMVERR